jgi:hypothetical protein
MVDSPEAYEALEMLKERIFNPSTGKQRKNVPAAVLNRYQDFRRMLQTQGEDISDYPAVRFPRPGKELQAALARDPNLAWDVRGK